MLEQIYRTFDADYETRLMNWLEGRFGREKFTPGLARIRPHFAPLLGQIEAIAPQIVTIAGTNGKGEVSHLLADYLQGDRQRVALWVSPHVLSIRERMLFDGAPIPYQKLDDLLAQAHRQLGPSSNELSFYEFLFFAFLKQCVSERPSHIVLEVGMGGRLDAVNLCHAHVVGIPSISRDHCQYLGPTYRQILREKIQVTRPKGQLISFFKLAYLRQLAKSWCEDHQVKYRDLSDSDHLAAPSNYFQRNQLLAQKLFFALTGKDLSARPTQSPRVNSLYRRSQEMTLGKNRFIFIGAHNLDGVRSMLQALSGREAFDQCWASYSDRSELEIEQMVQLLGQSCQLIKRLCLTFFGHPRAQTRWPLGVRQLNRRLSIEVVVSDDWRGELVQESDSNQKILVCGSYYFLGEVMAFLLGHSHRHNLGHNSFKWQASETVISAN